MLFIGALAVLLVLGTIGISLTGSPKRIATGVHVAGMDIGGLTPKQARAKLERTSHQMSFKPVTFFAGAKRFRIRPIELGIHVDWAAAVDVARRDGDGVGPVRALRRLRVRFFGADVIPPIVYSRTALNAFLRKIARTVGKPAREPAIVLRSLTPSLVPGHSGQTLDRRVAADIVARASASLSRSDVTLPVKVDEPSVSESDLQPVLEKARTALSAPVTIVLSQTRWKLDPARLAEFLELPSHGKHELGIGGAAADAYFANLEKHINRPAKDATFDVTATSARVVPSQDGLALDRKKSASALLRSALSPTARRARVSIEKIAPKRTTAEAKAMGISGVVGTYETWFSGTTNRIHNVQLVSKLIDKALIPPGEVFSFNKTTGERTSEKGFLVAPVIINGELETGLGGGICQVSTTVFNAAFEAGLDIVSRTNHALYISHYPLGRDATVNWPSTDLKFENDTDHWLLVRAFASSSTLRITLYGTPQHRRIEVETAPLVASGAIPVKKIPDPTLEKGQKVVEEVGAPARSTSVRRRVFDAKDKLLYDSTWYSSYRAEPKVVRIGTKPPAKDKGKGKPKPGTETTTTGETTTTTTTTTTETTSATTTPP